MRIIAMYLPQYYRTEENDLWWGEGYTDWTAVKGAEALFEGHDQPRVPLKILGKNSGGESVEPKIRKRRGGGFSQRESYFGGTGLWRCRIMERAFLLSAPVF